MRCGNSIGVGVDVVTGHVVEEVVDVGEEVIVGKVVVGVRGVRDEEVSCRAERSPKTLSPFSRTGLESGGVSEAYCPDQRCTLQAGMGKNLAAQSLELGGERKMMF